MCGLQSEAQRVKLTRRPEEMERLGRLGRLGRLKEPFLKILADLGAPTSSAPAASGDFMVENW